MADLADARIVNLFSSPFMTHVWADSAELNRELRQHILAYERENPRRGQSKSNVGGWHSQTGLLEFCGDAGQLLLRRAIEMANHATLQVLAGRDPTEFGWRLEAWANVNRPGDFNREHTHGMSTWSGTYYVDPGDPPAEAEHGTALEITDPCRERTHSFFPTLLPPGIYIRPEPGLMVLFPGYMPHMVFPHRGKRPRISIAFNLRKEPFP